MTNITNFNLKGQNNKTSVATIRKKELVKVYKVIDNNFEEKVDLRFYESRSRNSSTVYAVIWLNYPDKHWVGSGKASGYGFHHSSEALANALYNMGIVVDELGGVGDKAIEEAILQLFSKITGQPESDGHIILAQA